MVKLAQMIERHLAGILAHWKWGVTNAFMEGLNSVFSATKRKARSYRSTTHLIAMLFFTAGKLRLPSFYSTENSGEPTPIVNQQLESLVKILLEVSHSIQLSYGCLQSLCNFVRRRKAFVRAVDLSMCFVSVSATWSENGFHV